VVLAAALSLTLAASGVAQETSAADSARMPGVPFEELARRAGEAWREGRLEEALRFYRAGVELNPLWDEGFWYVGSIHHQQDRYAEARDAYRRVVELKPDAGAAWAMLGLCEYRLRQHDVALGHLLRAEALGVGAGEEIARATARHIALLLIRSGQFDLPARYLAGLARTEGDGPEFVAACGLMTLRMASLPADIPETDRDLVMATGRAVASALAGRNDEARLRFEALVARYPTTPRVHYAFGLFLSLAGSPEALPMLRQEIRLFPDNWQAHLQIALDTLTRGPAADAVAPAREAARLAPDVFAGHFALGRALLAVDEVDQAVRSLERARDLAPEFPDVYLALAQAYSRAGRSEDVKRVKERLTELHARQRAGGRP
jgi:tetratricopeptide (TPR) repeat protein